jgi:TolB-like protein/Tfp pilus assembly protein PilF
LPDQPPQPTSPAATWRGALKAAALALIALFVLAGAWLVGERLWQAHRLENAARTAAALPQGPTLAVLPVRAPQGDERLRLLAEGFTIQLMTRLAAFRRIAVLAPETVFRLSTAQELPPEIRRHYPALFALSGTLENRPGGLHLDMLLADMTSRRIVWSQSYDRPLKPRALLSALNGLALEIAATLGQPEGVIERGVTRSPLAGLKSLESFLCVARFYRYLRHKSETAHARVRACLEDIVRRESCYADAWAALSWIRADEYRLGYNRRNRGKTPLKEALAAARRAVDCDPGNATAWLYLGKAAFALGQDDEARGYLIRALRLNPGDANLLAEAGTTLALMGDWQAGLPLVRKALILNPYAPPWYHGILFLDAWRRGDNAAALRAARAYYRPNILLSRGFMAAALFRAGRHEAARRIMADMARNTQRPLEAFADQLRRWRVPEALSRSLVRTLRRLRSTDSG